MEIGVQRHRQFQVHPWNWAKKRPTKASQYSVTLNLIQSNTRQECVVTALTICLFSDLCSSLSRSDHKVRVGKNLCSRYACSLPTSEGSATSSQSKHWCANCRVHQTCSARPAPPALSERNEYVKETVPLKLFKLQNSNFKRLTVHDLLL